MVLAIVALLAVQAASVGQDTSRLRPLNLQEWVTEDDYPESAMRNGEEGEVAYDLTIRGDGTVERCEIFHSSGFAALDTTTCALLVQRARFKTLASGLHFRGRISWKMPERDPRPIAWGHSASLLHLSADNHVISCEDKLEGAAAEVIGPPCSLFDPELPEGFIEIIGVTEKPRIVVMEITIFFGNEPMPARYFATPGQIPIARTLVRFDIATSGKVENCREEPTGMERKLESMPSPCSWQLGPYAPLPGKGGDPLATSGTIEVAVSQAHLLVGVDTDSPSATIATVPQASKGIR